MRKIRYKEPSKSFESLTAPMPSKIERSSFGMDKFVGEYYFIEIEKLIPYKKQARISFDEKELENLAQTIKEHGIRQPLSVIRSADQDGVFEIVSGERRYRAAKMVGLEKVPCIIIDQKQAEEIALIENIQRSDLHPVEFGDALSSLMSNYGWGDISRLADKIGKDQPTISHHLIYSRLPEEIKVYLVENNIRSRDVLRRISKCDTVDQMKTILGLLDTENSIKTRSILRINMIGQDIKVQASAIKKTTREEREQLRECLVSILSDIDSME